MASPALSQASTAFESDPPQIQEDHSSTQKAAIERAKEVATSQDILLFLIAFRILNALSIRTFFQPDEYYQSLEPAWGIAFGADSGAWTTWEWKNQLRSAIHPAIFAAVYWLSAESSKLLQLSPTTGDELLLAAPKVTQAVIAALGDYYTWKLGERVYGKGSDKAWAALFLTVTSPWQWFCSTRTFSNCLETTLTIIALHQWPWHWSLPTTGDDPVDKYGLREDPWPDRAEELAKCVPEINHNSNGTRSMAYRLCRCLLLAALACVLRPTNVLIWICVSCFCLWTSSASGRLLKLPWTTSNLWIHITSLSHGPATKRERIVLVLEAAVCGSLIFIFSLLADHLYYRQWTFPPLRFLYFNLARSLSVHYGRNPWHYYLLQGYPLLLTTYLPFAHMGIYRSLFPPTTAAPHQSALTTTINRQLATTSTLIPIALSFISHKEVRFIYPLLPPLHILAAAPFATSFFPSPSPTPKRFKSKIQSLLLPTIVITNLLLALLSTQAYQSTPLSLFSYSRSLPLQHPNHPITLAFLTPCHSTPWRSHLLRSPTQIRAWALSCEPPLHLPPSQHHTYLDEADQFYSNPTQWLRLNLGKAPKTSGEQRARVQALETATGVAWDGKGEGKKVWGSHVVVFGALEKELMEGVLRASGYGVCWRGGDWVGGWNEDPRRKGGMVVFCLDAREKERWARREREEKMRWSWWWVRLRFWGISA
ncbi:MAG: hypothetical protein Q9219_007085 [cf. Caloplaca sp. 3 TL-2023]